MLVNLMLAVLSVFLWPSGADATLVNGHMLVNGTAMEGYELVARSCKDMRCVQQNIQVIDSQIADLIARRLAFVKRGAQLKTSVVVSDNIQSNPSIINQVTKQAQYQGYPPEIAQSIFREIDKQSANYESKYSRLNPTPIPNTSSIPTPIINTPNQNLTPEIVPDTQ